MEVKLKKGMAAAVVWMKDKEALKEYHKKFVSNSEGVVEKSCIEINEVLFDVLNGNVLKHGTEWPQVLQVLAFAMAAMRKKIDSV